MCNYIRVYHVCAIQETREGGAGGGGLSHAAEGPALTAKGASLMLQVLELKVTLPRETCEYMTQRAAGEEGGRGREKGRGEQTTDVACGSKTHRNIQYVQSSVSVW